MSQHALERSMLEALRAALPALQRLGDFVGNVDQGGASKLGRIDRCAIIGQVRDAIDAAEEAERERLLQNARRYAWELYEALQMQVQPLQASRPEGTALLTDGTPVHRGKYTDHVLRLVRGEG